MAYVPGFRYDLFLSYANVDNGEERWVEEFCSVLTKELEKLLGGSFTQQGVYLDKLRLRVGQAYPVELDDAAQESAFLLTFLSPSYLDSPWCSRERAEFQKKLAPGATFARSLGAIRLRKLDQLPEPLKSEQQANFVIDGFEEPWPPHTPKWIALVKGVAVQIKDALRELRKGAGKVFLGPTHPQDMDLRNRIAGHLAGEHFQATPVDALLDDDRASVEALHSAACAVHFLGGASDLALKRFNDSLQHCAGPTILFTPYQPDLAIEEELILAPLPAERYPVHIRHFEADLKQHLQAILTTVRAAAHARKADLGLVCETPDFEWARQFEAAGCSVHHPNFLEQNLLPPEKVSNWKQFFRGSRALLFYHGKSPEKELSLYWKLAEKENPEAFRKRFLAEPELDAKRQRLPDANVYPEGLEDFLCKARGSKGHSA